MNQELPEATSIPPTLLSFVSTARPEASPNRSFVAIENTRRIAAMQLQTIRPNLVQAIRAYRVEDLQQAASDGGQHFLYANLAAAQIKQDVLDGIAASFVFPSNAGRNLDTLYDCLTDVLHKAGPQPGFVIVLEQIPDNPRFDREAREQLLEAFRDAAEFWAERRIPFRAFYSFQ